MRLLVSLHDVTPAHNGRLEQAERLLTDLGVSRVAYFLVPDFHGRHPIADDAAFRTWCTRARPFEVDWVLHGYYHHEGTAPRGGGAGAWLKRRTMTGGEGEFLTLGAEAQHERLRHGLATLHACGVRTNAFVPPAWLSNDALPAALLATGLTYTEDHWHVIDVRRGRRRLAPAISWATRTTLRRIGSRVVCPALASVTSPLSAVRVAIHPHDLDHPKTRTQISRVLQGLLRRRQCASYAALFT